MIMKSKNIPSGHIFALILPIFIYLYSYVGIGGVFPFGNDFNWYLHSLEFSMISPSDTRLLPPWNFRIGWSLCNNFQCSWGFRRVSHAKMLLKPWEWQSSKRWWNFRRAQKYVIVLKFSSADTLLPPAPRENFSRPPFWRKFMTPLTNEFACPPMIVVVGRDEEWYIVVLVYLMSTPAKSCKIML